MIKANRTFAVELDGRKQQCIVITRSEVELPTYLLQGEKQCGYLYRDGLVRSWYWNNLALVGDERCLVFDPLPLFNIADIATTHRTEALELTRTLSEMLSDLPASFMDLSSGILPLWRIWGIEGGGILVLPQDLSDLFSSCAEEQMRYEMSSAWVHHGLHPAFTLCDQMTQLLYYAAVGFSPFSPKNSREDSFRALPVKLCNTGLSKEVQAFIDENLSASLTRQRDLTGNKESQKALTWFTEATTSLQWTLQNQVSSRTYEQYNEIPLCQVFLAKQKKRADTRIFWRKKGWIVISIAIAVIAIGSFTYNRVKIALQPPYTAGMDQISVIKEYYASQNALDLQNMEASLAKGVKDPAAMEVTNLFVTRQTRQAYEGINTQIDPNKWIAEGKPAIMEGTFIYGVTDLVVRKLDETHYEASGTLYTPYSYSNEESSNGERQAEIPIYQYQITQQFGVELAKRGWFEITSISGVQVKELGKVLVPTYSRNQGTAQPQ